jgi:hypothetical protein
MGGRGRFRSTSPSATTYGTTVAWMQRVVVPAEALSEMEFDERK